MSVQSCVRLLERTPHLTSLYFYPTDPIIFSTVLRLWHLRDLDLCRGVYYRDALAKLNSLTALTALTVADIGEESSVGLAALTQLRELTMEESHMHACPPAMRALSVASPKSELPTALPTTLQRLELKKGVFDLRASDLAHLRILQIGLDVRARFPAVPQLTRLQWNATEQYSAGNFDMFPDRIR